MGLSCLGWGQVVWDGGKLPLSESWELGNLPLSESWELGKLPLALTGALRLPLAGALRLPLAGALRLALWAGCPHPPGGVAPRPHDAYASFVFRLRAVLPRFACLIL